MHYYRGDSPKSCIFIIWERGRERVRERERERWKVDLILCSSLTHAASLLYFACELAAYFSPVSLVSAL